MGAPRQCLGAPDLPEQRKNGLGKYYRRKASALLLIVVRSLRSRCRKMSEPLDSGTRDLMLEMASAAFSFERAAT